MGKESEVQSKDCNISGAPKREETLLNNPEQESERQYHQLHRVN